MECQPNAPDYGNLPGIRASGPYPGQHLAEFRMNGFRTETGTAHRSHLDGDPSNAAEEIDG